MVNWKKIYNIYKVGGAGYVLAKIADKMSHSNYARNILHDKLSQLRPEQYGEMLGRLYLAATGEELDLEHPKTFNEKIQWLKLYDATPLKTRLADKYEVRQWIGEEIGEKYLIPLLGVWDNFDEIDRAQLPDRFVLKANHGSGWNVVVKDKGEVDWKKVKKQFDLYMKQNFAFVVGLELQYLHIKPKIIAETYMEDDSGGLSDYKVHCFNGEPKLVQVICDRDFVRHKAKETFYDLEWRMQPFTYTNEKYQIERKKPECFEEMIWLASKLCKDFAYVRVDFYYLGDRGLRFGEMTFTPTSGWDSWSHPEVNAALGDLLVLPKRKGTAGSWLYDE